MESLMNPMVYPQEPGLIRINLRSLAVDDLSELSRSWNVKLFFAFGIIPEAVNLLQGRGERIFNGIHIFHQLTESYSHL